MTTGQGAGPTAVPTSATVPEPMFTELSARRLGPVRSFFVRHPVAMDILVMAWFAVPALAMAAFPFLDGALRAISPEPTPSDPALWPPTPAVIGRAAFGLAGVTLTTVTLFWRRRQPVRVLAAVTVLGVATTAVTGSTHGFELAVPLMIYAVAVSRSSRATWLSFGGATAAMGWALWLWERNLVVSAGTSGAQDVLSDPASRIAGIVAITLGGLLAVAIGTSVRGRRQHLAELISRANALARDRDQQAALARAAERSRIAREMHDVVAHSLSVMIALADGAGAALSKSPERSKVALDELSATGRSALADMRRVLGVLDEPQTPFEPQPDSQDLGELVDRFRAAGMTISATGLTTPLPADAGLQLAVYRIVQESLTNTLRHAPATTRVTVDLARNARSIEVTVTDRGPGITVAESRAGSGRGVIGMRERVGVYGGVVEAGPWDAGWRVHAMLPWPHAPVDGDAAGESGGTESALGTERADGAGRADGADGGDPRTAERAEP